MVTKAELNAAFDVARATVDKFIETNVPWFFQEKAKALLDDRFVLGVVKKALRAADVARERSRPGRLSSGR